MTEKHATNARSGTAATSATAMTSRQHAQPSKKVNYVGAPDIFRLEQACHLVNEAFRDVSFGCFLVGSALERPDWRDVDVRCILSDEEFSKLFPRANLHGSWEFDARWLLLTTAISAELSRLSGLPVDFQFQPQTWANQRHDKLRHAIGMRVANEGAYA